MLTSSSRPTGPFFSWLLRQNLLRRVISMRAKQRLDSWLDDGDLHVVMIGTGTPVPDLYRAGPCTVVIAGGHFIVVDCGTFSFRKMASAGLPVASITGILLTHFHSDHITEVAEVATMSWAMGQRDTPMPVYGPEGVEDIVDGLNAVYDRDSDYRVEHHDPILNKAGSKLEARTIAIPGHGHDDWAASTVVALDESATRTRTRNSTRDVKGGPGGLGGPGDLSGELKITAFNVDHKPVAPAYGYRFEYRGRVVVVSGDTCKCDSVVRYSRDCDLLVMEAACCHLLEGMADATAVLGRDAQGRDGRGVPGMTTQSKLLHDIQDYHTDVQEAIDIAKEAAVPLMALTHLVPPLQNSWFLQQLWLCRLEWRGWKGKLVVGVDGDAFTLPAAATVAKEEREARGAAAQQGGPPNRRSEKGAVRMLNLFVRLGLSTPLRADTRARWRTALLILGLLAVAAAIFRGRVGNPFAAAPSRS